ncbi:hypothetical protein JL720_11644 [Aureococcus anophagefferens]|nr:hypothetical protein JL720_11644 [Aureococcus anophagefferens]
MLLIADDVGFNGVGYQSDYTNVSNGFLTPRLDALAAESLKLSSFYVLPLCAPTRGAAHGPLPDALRALRVYSYAPSKTFPDGCHRCVTGYDFHDGAAPAFDMNGTYSADAARRGGGVPARLYDLAADPMETSDVANRHPGVVRDLAARLEAHAARLPPPFEPWPPFQGADYACCDCEETFARGAPAVWAPWIPDDYAAAPCAPPYAACVVPPSRAGSGSAMDALAEYRATTFDGLRECRETLQELGKEELDEEDFDLATSRWKRAAARRPKALADAEASQRRGRLRAKRRRKDVARSMEIFCALYLLCDEACLDAKVAAIHALFDGDGDGYVPARAHGPRVPPAARGALRPRAGGLFAAVRARARRRPRRLPGHRPAAAGLPRGGVDAFAALLDANGGAADGLIGLDEFGDAVAAWVAFAVVDDDASGSLSAAELKFLLWVQAGDDGAEPGAHAVGRALAAMDADASGEIDRLEWLRYAACRDPVTGAARFSRADRAEFEANDRDGSADVSVREVRATFHKNAKDALARLELTEGVFSVETFELLNSLVRAAGDEIMHLVDKDRDGVISFSEYTAAKPIIKQKHDEILNYATVVVRHQHKDPAACARGRRRKAAGTRLSNVALLQSGSSEEF